MIEAKIKEVDLRELNADFGELTRGFASVRVRSMFPGTPLPCDFYYPSLNGNGASIKLEKILSTGQLYESELHTTLEDEGIDEVFISEADEDTYLTYFNELIQQYIKSPDTPTELKTQLLYDNAERIVAKVYRERPSATNVRLGKELVDSFAFHLTTEEVTVHAVLSLFSKDYYTFTHSVQVAVLGMQFCRYLGWTADEISDFGIGALFHDIGKNAIRDEILNKPAKLEAEEFEIIKGHSLLGFEQLSQAQVISESQLAVVLYHHEAMDGSGYPDGLHGTQIPRYARLAHIADVFDALTSKRVYKDALSHEEALHLMRNTMRGSFDAEMLDAFIAFLGMKDGETITPRRRLRIELTTRVILQYKAQGKRLKSTLVGMEDGEYLILRVSGLNHLPDFISGEKYVVARYTHEGTVFGFRSKVLGATSFPLRLLFLAFPDQVEELNLRKEPRIECVLPAKAVMRNCAYTGIVLDLSKGGCKLAIRNEIREKLPPVLLEEQIQMRIQLMGEAEAEQLQGIIRRVDTECDRIMLGIQFSDMSDNSLTSLQAFIDRMVKLTC